MPRKRVPDTAKILRGTFRPVRARSHVDFDKLDAPPPAPAHLGVEAARYWDRIAPLLLQRGVLSSVDLEALGIMCVLYGIAIEPGEEVNAALITQLRLYQTEFGLTPASRPRVPGGGSESSNPFSSNRPRGHSL